jgi:hypothetical protein
LIKGARSIHREDEIVINRLSGGKVKNKRDVLIFVAGVAERVSAIKGDFIRAVPKQTFLPVLEIQIDVDVSEHNAVVTVSCVTVSVVFVFIFGVCSAPVHRTRPGVVIGLGRAQADCTRLSENCQIVRALKMVAPRMATRPSRTKI